MLFQGESAARKRQLFRQALGSGRLLAFPGAFSPLAAMLIEEQGFDGVYVSGAVVAADLGFPDIGLTTMTEVVQRGYQIARTTSLPAIIDIDTGFGEPMNVARTVSELVEMGLSGCHIEDQMNPKRCGHLDHKTLVSTPEMVRRVRAAAYAKSDPNFVLVARTDARGVEGIASAIERAKAYVDAGADMIFPEALSGPKEFDSFRKALSVPLLANMTEFGKSELLDRNTLQELGYNLVLYPVTGLRLAMKALEDGLRELRTRGTQAHMLDRMQDRKRLYELLRYDEYNTDDQGIFNFEI